ncbi:MAG: cytochrome C biogenesis protein CycH, partial [Desulfobacteraceae bacterium]
MGYWRVGIMKTREKEMVLYQTADGAVRLEVRLEKESVWLDAHQMGNLFQRDRSVILRHIRNIYETHELAHDSTCAKIAQVAADGKTRQMDIFNLDVIIGVGYRVNSKRGTQFRIWATQVLKSHILKGYSVNARRLKELKQAVRLIGEVAERRDLTGDEAKALLRVIHDYSYALDLLDDYDHQRMMTRDLSKARSKAITYAETLRIVEELRIQFKAGELFGREKDQSLQASIGNILQTFDGREVYSSLEEKAAHLLYFLVKNHPFVDGNKRIGAALFLWFLEKNRALYRKDGGKRIADNA